MENRILIVEDQEDIRKVMRLTLENGARTIIEATTAEESLMLLDTLRFDILLVDIGLSGMNSGLGLAQQALDHPKQRLAQVAIVTGSDDPDHIQQAKEMGVAAYLMKPFSPGMLAAIVAKMESRITDTLIIPRTHKPDGPNSFGALRMAWPTLFF